MTIFSRDGSSININWSEDNQPEADSHFWAGRPYRYQDEQHLGIEVPIHHFAEYYKTHPQVIQWLSGNGWSMVSRVQTVSKKEYDNYRQEIMDFQVDPQIQLAAQQSAARIIRGVEFRTRKVVTRDRLSGRFDRRKIGRIEREVARGTYRHEDVRPYRRTEKLDSQLPTVVILGAMHTSAMNTKYTQGMIKLLLSLRWACETAGLPVYAAATQGRRMPGPSSFITDTYGPVRYATQLFMLSTPDYQPPVKVYATFMDHQLWMRLKVHLKGTHPDYANLIAGTEGVDFRHQADYGLYNRFATSSGGYAVTWARQTLNADLVIACGNIADGGQADLYLPFSVDVDEAIDLLERKLRGV